MNQMQMNFQLETSPLFMISAYSFIICLHLYTAILKTVCMGKKFWASLFFLMHTGEDKQLTKQITVKT